jgi:Ca2+-binding RTX toxin-like protein
MRGRAAGSRGANAPRVPLRFVLLVCSLTALLAPSAASAATINVDAIADDNPAGCGLREAVTSANNDAPSGGCVAGAGNDVIVLAPGTYALTQGDLEVAEAQNAETLTIVGAAAGSRIVASPGDRAITAQTPLTLADLTVRGGNVTGNGGGISAGPGALTLTGVAVLDNRATMRGGGVFAAGPLTVTRSTIAGNEANSANPDHGGAGIASGTSPTLIRRSTVARNEAKDGARGGGLLAAGTVTFDGSIVHSNSAAGGDADCRYDGGSGASQGFNVMPAACAAAAQGDLDADPGLAPGAPADNGGPVPTLRLQPGSAGARNRGPAGPACSGAFDGRGFPRGIAETGACDAGAYELAICGVAPVNVWGNAAANVLTRPPPPVNALGFAGDDTLVGGPGNDSLCGGEGADTLSGGSGADLLHGGPGVDIATYGNVTTPLVISLDGVANDGAAGEGDNVITESVVGGAGNDRITGDAVRNGLLGGPGNDVIAGLGSPDTLIGEAGDDTLNGGEGDDSLHGYAGNDSLNGEAGNDTLRGDGGNDSLRGGAGNDRLRGGAGNDKLAGEAGNDVLEGGGGKDTLNGGPGSDILRGGKGRDRFICGPGRDTVHAERGEKVARDCEKVFRRRR